jgi:hypothetical protein
MKDLALVKTYTSRTEASLAKTLLEAHGIRCIISADDAGGMMPSYVFGVELRVLPKDIQRAKEIISTDKKTAS